MILSHTCRNKIDTFIQLPSSKSISNRLLVLKSFYFPNLSIQNISKSTDTKNLQNALNTFDSLQDGFKINAGDGGTTFRFLIVLLLTKNLNGVLTGSPKLLERPNKPFIDCLQKAGFPVSLNPSGEVIFSQNKNNNISTNWDIDITKSSQYASALSMFAPYLGNNICIKLTGEAVSIGYLDLTLSLMQYLQIDIVRNDNTIKVDPFQNRNIMDTITVESDWSGLSYFISIAILSKQSIRLANVNQDSNQPDKAVLEFGAQLGLTYRFDDTTLILNPTKSFRYPKSISRNYTNCPDIALTEIVVCFALGIKLKMSGISHLKYKESDRLTTIRTELQKFNGNSPPFFNTHDDHRIAMSLAPLAILKPISFDNPEVVSKSFPDFWNEIAKLGFEQTPLYEQ